MQLWTKLPTRESAEAWEAIGVCLASLARMTPHVAQREQIEFEAILAAMESNYKTARHERNVHAEILDVAERVRKMSETEAKREATLQANLTSQQAIALMNGIFRIHVDLIQDLTLRKSLGEAMLKLLGAPEVVRGDTTLKRIAEASDATTPS